MSDWNERYVTGDTPWSSGLHSLELVRVLEGRGIAPCRALEIGCGTGANSEELARRGFDVVGFDLAERAVEQARARVAASGFSAELRVGAVGTLDPAALDGPFGFVFDRGVYHGLRREPDGLAALLTLLREVMPPGALWLSLAGNANEVREGEGPPVVTAFELCAEREADFELVQLREMRFRRRLREGEVFEPLGWSVLSRRRSGAAP